MPYFLIVMHIWKLFTLSLIWVYIVIMYLWTSSIDWIGMIDKELIFFKKWVNPGLFLFILGFFKQTIKF